MFWLTINIWKNNKLSRSKQEKAISDNSCEKRLSIWTSVHYDILILNAITWKFYLRMRWWSQKQYQQMIIQYICLPVVLLGCWRRVTNIRILLKKETLPLSTINKIYNYWNRKDEQNCLYEFPLGTY